MLKQARSTCDAHPAESATDWLTEIWRQKGSGSESVKRKQKRSTATSADEPKRVSARTLWRWKRQQQARDRELAASGKPPPEGRVLIRPEMLKGARIIWPNGSLIDDPLESRRKASNPLRARKSRTGERIPSTLKTGLEPLLGEAPTILILGSFPSEESLRTQRYYANPKNQFWHLMEAIAGIKQDQPYEKRVDAMTAKGIAVWDVLHSCERDGSSDCKIKMRTAMPNNLCDLLARMPSIKIIGLNGTTASMMFDRFFNVHGQRLEIVTLPSSSSAHVVKLEEKSRAWSALMDAERRWEPKIRDASTEYGEHIARSGLFSESLSLLQQQYDKRLACLHGKGAAKRLRRAIRSPVRLRGQVKVKKMRTRE